MQDPDSAAQRQAQREIAAVLFDRYTSLAIGTLEEAREGFIQTVAPWVNYDGDPSPDEIREAHVNMVIGLHEAYVALRGILPALNDRNWRLRDAVEATNRLGLLLDSDMPPLSVETL